MAKIIRRFYLLILAWFHLETGVPDSADCEQLPPKVDAPKRIAVKASKPKGKEVEELGEFFFRDKILDQLDNYFICIKQMKKSDREAFDLYSKMGAHLLPYRFLHIREGLSPWWKATRPSFGAVAFALDPRQLTDEAKSKSFYPRFFYFTKYQPRMAPATIQPVRGENDIYIATAYWDNLSDSTGRFGRLSAPTQFPVSIDDAGAVRVLKTHICEDVTIRHRRGPRRGKTFTIPQRKWTFDRFFVEWAAQHKRSPEEHLADLFIQTANAYEAANRSTIRVDVRKGALHAAFGVNIKRTPYFFKDRDVSAEREGGKRKIFHIVRAHERVTSTGNTTAVRFHFRGERQFSWNGYAIQITVPALHHLYLAEMNVGAIDGERADDLQPDKLMDERATGEWMRRQLDRDRTQEKLP